MTPYCGKNIFRIDAQLAKVLGLHGVLLGLKQIPLAVLVAAGHRILPVKKIVCDILFTQIWELIWLRELLPAFIIFSCEASKKNVILLDANTP